MVGPENVFRTPQQSSTVIGDTGKIHHHQLGPQHGAKRIYAASQPMTPVNRFTSSLSQPPVGSYPYMIPGCSMATMQCHAHVPSPLNPAINPVRTAYDLSPDITESYVQDPSSSAAASTSVGGASMSKVSIKERLL